jgi:hypothetical protein
MIAERGRQRITGAQQNNREKGSRKKTHHNTNIYAYPSTQDLIRRNSVIRNGADRIHANTGQLHFSSDRIVRLRTQLREKRRNRASKRKYGSE